jgi:hypothetical protein
MDMQPAGLNLSDIQFERAALCPTGAETGLTSHPAGPPGAPPMTVFCQQDGLVIGAPGVLGVRRGGGLLLFTESVPFAGQIEKFGQECLAQAGPQPESLETFDCACLLHGKWSDNFWHWFTEFVPKVAALEEIRFDGVYLVPEKNPAFGQSLEFLGIPAARIKPHGATWLSVRRLFFTESFNGHDLARWPWLLERIRSRLPPAGPADLAPEKLYIGRRGEKRFVLNKTEAIGLLARHGFAIVYMEDLSISQQMIIAQNARIIVGPHGAGMVYAMFMQPGGALIEMFHARYVNPCMLAICNVLRLDYRMLVSNVNPPDSFRTDDAIMVDVKLFALTLETVIRLAESPRQVKDVPAVPVAAQPPAQEKPLNMKNLMRVSEFLHRYQSDNPYGGFNAASVPLDTQGFQSPENVRFFGDIFNAFRPCCMLELGSWKGTSAIMFVKHMLTYCEKPALCCVDTWLGSVEHWSNPEWRIQLGLRNGYPTLFERFMANVVRAHLTDYVTPFPMTTKTGIALARNAGIKFDAIYVDASNEYADVLEDLAGAWDLIGDEGVMIADDFKAPDVHRAIQEFCSRPGVFGLYNVDVGWPEALFVKSDVMRERALAAHAALVDIS